jgi:phasin family protein
MSASINPGNNTTAKAKVAEAVTAVTQATAEAAKKTYDQAEGAMSQGVSQATAGFERTQAKMKEGMEKAMKTAEEFVSFSQGNMEAVVKSGQIWAAGMQDISKQVAATAQASFEETLSAFRALSGVRSLKDAIEVQTNLARATFEKTLAESGRITDASMKLAEQTIAPLTARVTLAVEKFARTV